MRLKLSPYAGYTFHYHLRAQFFEGIFNGVWLLNDVVARKHFSASPLLITLLVMAPSAALIISLPLGPAMAFRKKRWFFLTAGFARLSLALVPLFSDAAMFVVLATVASASWPFLFTAQNSILKGNYGDSVRGRLFGLAYSLAGLVAIFCAVSLGSLYDLSTSAIKWAYPIAGASGFISCYLFSRIRERKPMDNAPALSRPWEILKKRPDFRRFEAAFFSYGIGFMMMLPLLPLFLVDHLKVSYSQASFLNGVFYMGMIVVFSWLIGRLADSTHPLRLVKAGFFALFAYPLGLSLCGGVHSAYIVYGWYGFCMAIVNVTWYLAPMTFCRAHNEVSSFMSVHVALAGIRSFIAFPLGTALFYATGGFYVPFIVSSSFFLLGGLLTPSKEDILPFSPK